jgi:hypothetical protein
MPQFLDRKKAIVEIEALIRNINKRVIIISPYLRLSKELKELILFRSTKGGLTTSSLKKVSFQLRNYHFFKTLVMFYYSVMKLSMLNVI